MTIGEEPEIYIVVVNHEEQYSIWAEYKTIPEGWSSVGQTGSKEECLEYIKTVWTDMRPLSLRRQMPAQEPAGNTVSN